MAHIKGPRSSQIRLKPAHVPAGKRPGLVDDFARRRGLLRTPELEMFLEEQEQKRLTIDEEFYRSRAMQQAEWKGPEAKNKRLITGAAVHGYHHKLCKLVHFHSEATDLCVCKYCSQKCTLYHIRTCKFCPPLWRIAEA